MLLPHICVAPLVAWFLPEEPVRALLDYQVRLRDPAQPVVEVEARFAGLPRELDELELSLPQGFAYVSLPEPLMEGGLEAHTTDGTVLECTRVNPYLWRVHKGRASEVRMHWKVPQRFQSIPQIAERDGYEYPYVAEDHGLLATATLLWTPTAPFACDARVRFDLPTDWPVLTPWTEAEPLVFAPQGRSALANDQIAIGAWSAHSIEAGGMQITLAYAPGQESLQELSVEPLARIMQAEVELFGMRPQDKYLFAFVKPQQTSGYSFAGSIRTGSMVLQVALPVMDRSMLEPVAHLVAHEFHHTWGRAAVGEFSGDLRFMFEGFTDYYAYQVPARLGLLGDAQLETRLGEILAGYQSLRGSAGHSLRTAGGQAFFSEPAAYDLVYKGGLLLASLLDLELQRAKAPAALDGFLRRFLNQKRWSEQAPGLADFLAQVEAELGAEASHRFRDWIESTEGFDAQAELVTAGARVESVREPRSIRANFDGTTTLDIDPACEAYRLGLRTGDRLLEVNGVKVEQAGDIQRAWQSPQVQQSSLMLVRDGSPLTLQAPVEAARLAYRVKL